MIQHEIPPVKVGEVATQFPRKLAPIFQPQRYKVARGGRGGAKSWGFSGALVLMTDAPEQFYWGRELGRKKLRVLCGREIQKSIAESVHQVIAQRIQAQGMGDHWRINNNNIVHRHNGSEFIFAGLRDQDAAKIKSVEDIDICWLEEAHTIRKESWKTLTPTIRKKGSEIWVSYNPELETDETHVRFTGDMIPTDTVIIEINWRDNPWFKGTALEQERLDCLKNNPDEYDHIWEGQPLIVLPGAIYAKEVMRMMANGQVGRVPYDPLLPVHTVQDIGWNDTTFILFVQKLRAEIRVIGCYEESGTKVSEDIAAMRSLPWVYAKHWLPHDAFAATKAAGGISVAKQYLRLRMQIGRVPGPQHASVENGIKQVRAIFPRLYIDEHNAGRVVECLKRYRRGIPTTTGEPGDPVHDEYSHGADAVRYLSLVEHRMHNDDQAPAPRVAQHVPADPGAGY